MNYEKEIKPFLPRKPNILKFVREKGIDKVSEFCATTMIPLIVAYTFICEEIEEFQEFAENKIKELRKFYDQK